MSGSLDRPSAKILVLGDSGVGKSSLIHLICHSTVLNSAQWTIGCSIDVKQHEGWFFEFWDIGGSRGHKIARSFLYQDYHGIILVFDSTNKKSRSNLDEWLVEVSQKTSEHRELDKQFPIIYIGTKKDLLPYGTTLESGWQTEKKNESFSVVDFDAQKQNDSHQVSTATHRRRQSSNNDLTPLVSFNSLPNLPPFQPISNNNHVTRPVIYVNTQDALCLSQGTDNYRELYKFFKRIIDRRTNKFYF